MIVPIDSYPYEIRDELKKQYVAKGPTQPRDHKFPQSNFSEGRRLFQKIWYTKHTWLEYSVHKVVAFYFCCYLFAKYKKNGDDVFPEVGFKNWKKCYKKVQKT